MSLTLDALLFVFGSYKQNDEISYIFCIMPNHQPGHLYYGKRIRDREDFSHLMELGFRDMSPCVFGGNAKFSLERSNKRFLYTEQGTCEAADIIRKQNIQEVGFEGGHLSYSDGEHFKALVQVQARTADGWVEEFRAIKDEDEIRKTIEA